MERNNDISNNKFKFILIKLLETFDDICSKNNLRYFACAGTALGAIRHHGIIPWDDDIDVFMPREDYDKFLLLYSKNSTKDYRVARLGDSGYIYPFAKMYDRNTTLIELKIFPSCCIGVYIDIFPLDEVSGSLKEIESTKREYDRLFSDYQSTFIKPTFHFFLQRARIGGVSELWRMISCICSSKKRKIQIRNRFVEFEKLWKKQKGDMLLCHHGMYRLDKELMPKNWFDSYIYVPFETTKIRIVENYDEYLSHLFGDYMTPPPIELRKTHHPHYYLNLKEGLSQEEVKQRIKRGEHFVY